MEINKKHNADFSNTHVPDLWILSGISENAYFSLNRKKSRGRTGYDAPLRKSSSETEERERDFNC